MLYKDRLIPGEMYHIYNRGNNRESIFKEHKNYAHFLNLWKTHIYPVAGCYAYSLLPNHFHFLIKTLEMENEANAEKKIQQAFSNFFNAYCKSINHAYNRTGSLFQERFGRKMIDADDYFSQIVWYIHSNAQKHQITDDFTGYPYSSYQSLLSEKSTSLYREDVLEWFGNKEQFIKFHIINHTIVVDYLKTLEF
jgi:putative transposase